MPHLRLSDRLLSEIISVRFNREHLLILEYNPTVVMLSRRILSRLYDLTLGYDTFNNI